MPVPALAAVAAFLATPRGRHVVLAGLSLALDLIEDGLVSANEGEATNATRVLQAASDMLADEDGNGSIECDDVATALETLAALPIKEGLSKAKARRAKMFRNVCSKVAAFLRGLETEDALHSDVHTSVTTAHADEESNSPRLTAAIAALDLSAMGPNFQVPTARTAKEALAVA